VDYERTRYPTSERIDAWCARIGAWFEVSMPQTRVLDLGSGTGIWSAAIADRFCVDVVGVEPAAGMRSVAADRGNPRVDVVAGSAAAIPLADCTATSAWLSTVVHHFDDLTVAAQELRRVLATPAPVLIRNWFADRLDGVGLLQHFPAAGGWMKQWRTLYEVVEIFERCDFGFAGLERIEESGPVDYDQLLEALPRMRHSDSLFAGLDDADWEAGVASVRRARDRGDVPGPLGLDLLVFH
jgi:SAM-dependent methyltransferase